MHMKNKKETSNKFLLLFYSYPRIAIAIILVLVNLVVVALFTGILALVRETNYFSELPYVFIFTMSSDGLYDYTADKDIACLVIKIVLALIQMVIFSGALIGFTTDVLSSTFDTRLENKGKLHLKNHYVLLNWSSIGPNIVYELSFLEGEQTIVILSENERDEVINSIDNIFTLNNKKKKGVRIFVKKGDPNSLKHLSDISIDNAKCVGILLKDHEDVLSEEKGILIEKSDTADTYGTHHLYLLRIDPKVVGGNIQQLAAKLAAKGLTNITHFGPMYRFKIMRDLGYNEHELAASCPRTEEMFYHSYTHLPLYPLTEEQLVYQAQAVVDAVRELKQGR